MLQKGLKSLQIRLNELCLEMPRIRTISKSAFTQARKKLKHTAFIELNEVINSTFYSSNEVKYWNGYLITAADGSRITLPDSEEVLEKFGGQFIPETENHEATLQPSGKMVVYYDVLNKLALNTFLSRYDSYEVELAYKAVEVSKNELALFDRHYASYEFIAWLSKHPGNFIIRCPKSTFKEGMRLFEGGPWSKEVTLCAPGGTLKHLRALELPTEVKVRFVRVKLPNGEKEVLVTSLLSNNCKLDREDFKEAYGLRWGIETFFLRIKERLNLENFTGKSVESVMQDLHATLFISNLESVLIDEAQEALTVNSKNCFQEKKVNKSVSFNVIKNKIFELLYDKKIELDSLLIKITELFMQSPNLERKGRKVDRGKSGPYRVLRHNKTKKKTVF